MPAPGTSTAVKRSPETAHANPSHVGAYGLPAAADSTLHDD
jgi:hypothetical protein